MYMLPSLPCPPDHPVSSTPPDVVMTASKRGIESVIRIERIAKNEVNYSDVYHVAGGPLKGIVINRAKKGQFHFTLILEALCNGNAIHLYFYRINPVKLLRFISDLSNHH